MKLLIKYLLNTIFIFITFIRNIGLGRARKIEKLLLIEMMGIGDVVCHTPFLQEIKNSPKYRIYGCFPKHLLALQKKFCQLDGYIEYTGVLSTIKKIRQSDVDGIILNARALRYAGVALFSGKKVIGYINDYSYKFNYLNNYKVEFLGIKAKSYLVNYLNLHLVQRGNPALEFLGLSKIDLLPKANFHPQNSDYVVIHAGADFAGRQWPAPNFRIIIEFLLNKFEKQVKKIYLLGGKQDFELNEQISKNIEHCINVAEEMNLSEVYDLIKGARYFIGNDSGPLHIAAMLNTPVIGFYGPNLPQISGPYTSRRIVFFKKMPCAPCNQRSCKLNYKCINSISVEEVQKELERLENQNEKS